jgi:hypothetical protein
MWFNSAIEAPRGDFDYLRFLFLICFLLITPLLIAS